MSPATRRMAMETSACWLMTLGMALLPWALFPSYPAAFRWTATALMLVSQGWPAAMMAACVWECWELDRAAARRKAGDG